MANTEKFIVEGRRDGNGVPSSGGIRDPKSGRLISQYTNPRPYHELAPSTRNEVDYGQAKRVGRGRRIWGGIKLVASELWAIPEVRQGVGNGIGYLTTWIDDLYWEKRAEREDKKSLEVKRPIANYKEVQPEEPSKEETLADEVERLKKEGKIVDFPNRKVI